jgi:hypothetical protein
LTVEGESVKQVALAFKVLGAIILFYAVFPTIADAYLTVTSRDCSESGQADTLLTKEPKYKNHVDGKHRWVTEDGCKVRLDVLVTSDGTCGPPTIGIGTPIGPPVYTGEVAGAYVYASRFPRGSLQELLGVGQVNLPDDAVPTGYQRSDHQLWLVPGDSHDIYLVSARNVERWEVSTFRGGCV